MSDVVTAEPQTADTGYIATLVHPDEYVKNPNQVAVVTRKAITFVKRKEFAMSPYALEDYPSELCTSVTYKKRFALVPAIFGVVCLACAVLPFILPVAEAGYTVKIGLLCVMAITGATLVFGIKRHRLTFLINGKKRKWQSKAGDFKYKKPPLARS